jgi:hypothetical protein
MQTSTEILKCGHLLYLWTVFKLLVENFLVLRQILFLQKLINYICATLWVSTTLLQPFTFIYLYAYGSAAETSSEHVRI